MSLRDLHPLLIGFTNWKPDESHRENRRLHNGLNCLFLFILYSAPILLSGTDNNWGGYNAVSKRMDNNKIGFVRVLSRTSFAYTSINLNAMIILLVPCAWIVICSYAVEPVLFLVSRERRAPRKSDEWRQRIRDGLVGAFIRMVYCELHRIAVEWT